MPDKLLETDLIEKEVKDQNLSDNEKTIVNTTLRLLEDYQPTRLNKIQKVKRTSKQIDKTLLKIVYKICL